MFNRQFAQSMPFSATVPMKPSWSSTTWASSWTITVFSSKPPPFANLRLEPFYASTVEGSIPMNLEQLSGELKQAELNKAGGFENYQPLPRLRDRTTYIFRVLEK